VALYGVVTGNPPAAADLNQVISLLSGSTPQLVGSVSVANRIRAQLTGATATSGLVGSTVNGPPTSGAFSLGDLVVDTGYSCLWVCTTAGTPGTWTRIGGSAWASELLNRAVTQLLTARTGRTGFDVLQMGGTGPICYANLTMPGASTTSYGFQVPTAGLYLFYGQLFCVGPTGGSDVGIMILKNGQPYQFGTQFLSYANPCHTFSFQVPCAVNDLVQFGVYAENGYTVGSSSGTSFNALSAVYLAN
jgi:hypothetical protein